MTSQLRQTTHHWGSMTYHKLMLYHQILRLSARPSVTLVLPETALKTLKKSTQLSKTCTNSSKSFLKDTKPYKSKKKKSWTSSIPYRLRTTQKSTERIKLSISCKKNSWRKSGSIIMISIRGFSKKTTSDKEKNNTRSSIWRKWRQSLKMRRIEKSIEFCSFPCQNVSMTSCPRCSLHIRYSSGPQPRTSSRRSKLPLTKCLLQGTVPI